MEHGKSVAQSSAVAYKLRIPAAGGETYGNYCDEQAMGKLARLDAFGGAPGGARRLRVIRCATLECTLTLFALSSAIGNDQKVDAILGFCSILGRTGTAWTGNPPQCYQRRGACGLLRDAIAESSADVEEAAIPAGDRLLSTPVIYQAASKFYKVKNLSSDTFWILSEEAQGIDRCGPLIRTGANSGSQISCWGMRVCEFVF
jgi:hypothetical protein